MIETRPFLEQLRNTMRTFVFGLQKQSLEERFRNVILVLTLAASAMASLIPRRPGPDDAAWRSAFGNALIPLLLAWSVCFRALAIARMVRQRQSISSLLALSRIALVVLFCLAVGSTVVNRYLAWSFRHSSELLVFYPALLLVMAAAALVPTPSVSFLDPCIIGYVALCNRFRRKKRSPSEIALSAIHEAGHTLVASAFDPLPDEFVAEVFDCDVWKANPDRNLSFYVARVDFGATHAPISHLRTAPALRLGMQFFLAGSGAEALLTGAPYAGCADDMRGYNRLAATYLACGFGGPCPFGEAA